MLPFRYHARTPIKDRSKQAAADPNKYREWSPESVEYRRYSWSKPVSLPRIELSKRDK